MSKLRIPRIVALAVVVAIFVMVAGLSTGEDAAPVPPATYNAPAFPYTPAPPATGSEAGTPGLAGAAGTPPVIVDVEPHGDNEHFGVANVGTATVDLGGFEVAIDNGNWITLPQHTLAPGEEANVLFTPGASANEPGEKDLFLAAAGLGLNDNAGRIALRDSTGIVRSEVTYSHTPPEPAGPIAPAAPLAPATPGTAT